MQERGERVAVGHVAGRDLDLGVERLQLGRAVGVCAAARDEQQAADAVALDEVARDERAEAAGAAGDEHGAVAEGHIRFAFAEALEPRDVEPAVAPGELWLVRGTPAGSSAPGSASSSTKRPGYSDCALRIRPQNAAPGRSGRSSSVTATAPRVTNTIGVSSSPATRSRSTSSAAWTVACAGRPGSTAATAAARRSLRLVAVLDLVPGDLVERVRGLAAGLGQQRGVDRARGQRPHRQHRPAVGVGRGQRDAAVAERGDRGTHGGNSGLRQPDTAERERQLQRAGLAAGGEGVDRGVEQRVEERGVDPVAVGVLDRDVGEDLIAAPPGGADGLKLRAVVEAHVGQPVIERLDGEFLRTRRRPLVNSGTSSSPGASTPAAWRTHGASSSERV